MPGIADKLDKAYETKSLEELADAPVAALQGVSDGDAEKLKAAFGIVTIKDLGTNKFFLWAQAIARLAE
jgi:ABC-type amino acid transport substrate-binding protein